MGAPSLYEKYHISRQDERLGLFEVIQTEFGTMTGLYPGCFVHVTPSFVIPEMHYVDSDRNARRFFESGSAEALVEKRRVYGESPRISFYSQDYTKRIPIADGSVDLLVSQYGGLVSEACKRYLVRGGYLIANNSHGDAGLAWCDGDFRLVAVVNRRAERWTLQTRDLSDYFVPKSTGVPQTRAALADHIRSLGRGIGYTKAAADYVFERI